MSQINESGIKTPGVYINEIPLFPPSIAQVETAIPAFIGYTSKAKDIKEDDLLNKPIKISSMMEYVEKFGGSPDLNLTKIELDSFNEVKDATLKDDYYLYNCLRLFYANGGGDCYIISVGKFPATIAEGDLILGLNSLFEVDEPTLILIPDSNASSVSQAQRDNINQTMLRQCGDLQDRFSIFDIPKELGVKHADAVDNFRNGLGMSFLNYGAAYTPWLKTNLSRTIHYNSIKGKVFKSNNLIPKLSDLVTDPVAKSTADRLENLIDDQDLINTEFKKLHLGVDSIDNKATALFIDLRNSDDTNALSKLQDLIDFFVASLDFIRDTIDQGGTSITLKDKSLPSTPANEKSQFLFDFLEQNLTDSQNKSIEKIDTMIDQSDDKLSAALTQSTSSDITFGNPNPALLFFDSGTNDVEKILSGMNEYTSIWSIIKSALDRIKSSSKDFVNTVEKSALESIPTLKTIYRHLEREFVILPPSAAIAGIYARVDRSRGVWKAPANESLNNVIDLTETIDDNKQQNLNVDVIAGKSINAIRRFQGKGFLVWGARTLAGNDSEWRYVNVRRFFIMVEESSKKATMQFVFEPNDANTWVKLRAMLENYLTLLWRQGALAGAKPEHAFYVRCGLGQTMTAQDILDGKLIVEIGMAAVRPAEFIILRFSHKMQES